MSLKFSNNSETFASKLLENLQEICSLLIVVVSHTVVTISLKSYNCYIHLYACSTEETYPQDLKIFESH